MAKTIHKISDFCKSLLQNDELFTIALVIMVGVAAFGLGRGSVQQTGQLAATIEPEKPTAASVEKQEEPGEVADTGEYVGSVNSDKYHLPWCSGAKRINKENEVWFDSKKEAEAAGYKPAGNCPGL